MNESADRIAYQTVILQFRPVVSSDERLNVGVLVYAPQSGRVASRLTTRYQRLSALYPELKGSDYRHQIRFLSGKIRQLSGKVEGQGNLFLKKGDQVSLDGLLREILPSEGSNFVWSSIRLGICRDLELKTDELFQEFILRFEERKGRERLDDQGVWDAIRHSPPFRSIAHVLKESVTIATPDYEYTFTAGWQNGTTQVVEPVSLDYVEPRAMLEEANRWRGRLAELARDNSFAVTLILSEPPQDKGALEKYEQAKAILRRSDNLREVFDASEALGFVSLIQEDLAKSH